MVRPDLDTWGHTLDDLRRFAVQAQHPRSRERLLALYMIASQLEEMPKGARESRPATVGLTFMATIRTRPGVREILGLNVNAH